MNKRTQSGFDFAKSRDFKCFCCQRKPPDATFLYSKSGLLCYECLFMANILGIILLLGLTVGIVIWQGNV